MIALQDVLETDVLTCVGNKASPACLVPFQEFDVFVMKYFLILNKTLNVTIYIKHVETLLGFNHAMV